MDKSGNIKLEVKEKVKRNSDPFSYRVELEWMSKSGDTHTSMGNSFFDGKDVPYLNEYLFLLNELKKVDITEYDKVEGFKKWFNPSEYEFASEKESYDYKFFVNLEPEYDSYYSNTYAKLVGFKLYYYDAFLEKYNVAITLK